MTSFLAATAGCTALLNRACLTAALPIPREAVWLFGSRAMGRHQPGSDLDLRLMAAVDDLLLRISPEERIGKKARSI